jgi:hypothetical protein
MQERTAARRGAAYHTRACRSNSPAPVARSWPSCRAACALAPHEAWVSDSVSSPIMPASRRSRRRTTRGTAGTGRRRRLHEARYATQPERGCGSVMLRSIIPGRARRPYQPHHPADGRIAATLSFKALLRPRRHSVIVRASNSAVEVRLPKAPGRAAPRWACTGRRMPRNPGCFPGWHPPGSTFPDALCTGARRVRR